MAFSDARNERDRAETGKNSSNHGGGDARAAAERNINAMSARNSVAGVGPGTRPAFQPRRTPNPTPSYDMSLHNMMELGKMMPGPAMGLRGLGGALGLGIGPEFTGYRGNVQGVGDYDGPNRFATLGSNQNPGPQGLNLAQAFRPKPTGAVKMAPPVNPMLSQPGLQMNSGLQGYGTYRPGYNFIGRPFR